MSNAVNVPNVCATPSKPERLPFPQSSPSPAHVPHRQVATSAASSTSLALPSSVPKDRQLTSASLLKLHANNPDPKTAALDHAINERNTLSAQNAQLWKLIEKQRAGYNQILKELERVRGERDGAKAKLALSGSNTSGSSDRRRKSNDGDRPTNHSANENSLSPHNESRSFNGSNSGSTHRQVRHNSDDQRMPFRL